MLIAALAAIVVFSTSQQQPQQPQAQPQPEQTEADARTAEQERLICRRQRVIGSNRPQRVCLTRAQWTEIRENAVEGLDRHNRGDALPTEDLANPGG